MKKRVLMAVVMAFAAVCLFAASALALSDAEYLKMKKSSPAFAKADKELNQVWNEAKKVLGKSEFRKLSKEQQEWIAEGRDDAAEELIDDGMDTDEAYATVTKVRAKVIRAAVEKAKQRERESKPVKQGKKATSSSFYAIYERKDGVYFESHGSGSKMRIEFFDGDFTWEGDGVINGQKLDLRDGKGGRMTLVLTKQRKDGLITVITVKGNGKLNRLDGTYNAYEGHM